MSKPKFSLLSLLGMISLVCLGVAVYELTSQPPLPAMPSASGCVLGPARGRVYDPLERVYIAGPSDSDDVFYSPNY